jgi:tRNA A37 methylthiotransferase MiaB
MAGCAVVDLTEKQSIEKIIALKNVAKKGAKIIAYGCISTIAEKKLKSLGDIIIIKHQEEQQFDQIFKGEKKFNEIITNETICNDINSNIHGLEENKLSERRIQQKELCEYLDKTYNTDLFSEAFRHCTYGIHARFEDENALDIKIGQGCLGQCSYCAIRFAKGTIKSISADKILSQLQDGINKGYRKFYFIADEVGHWGVDIGDDICNLLDKIAIIAKEKPIKLLLNFFHPDKLISSYERLLPHLESGLIHTLSVTFQTASQRIMKLMNRKTDVKKMKAVFEDMKNRNIKTYLQCNTIVGFPGETREEFYETLEFCRDANFAAVVATPFSPREGTPAAKFKGQISNAEMGLRWRETVRSLDSFRGKYLLQRIASLVHEFNEKKN